MAEKTIPVKAAAYSFIVSLADQSNPMVFKSSPTLAAGDVKVDKDGAGLANLTDLPTASGKLVTVTLTATEMNADEVTVVFSDAAGAEWCDLVVVLHPSSVTIGDIDTAILDATVEGTYSVQEVLRIMVGVLAGKATGGGTTTVTFRDLSDSLDRVKATVDTSGNRSAVTLDVT